jgi:PAS domain S-box-containing protein
VWVPKALLEAPVRALWWTIGLTAFTAFALVVALASWLGRIIARSVGHAARAAIALGEGGQVVLSGTPVAEVDTLIAELRRSAARRQAADDLLHESEATFRAMFEVSSVGKIEIEPKTGRFLRANAAMCKFVGYSEAELLARTVLDITHPDDRDSARELLRRMVTGELAVFDMEKRYIRKDGNTVWARVTANIIRGESGQPLRDTAVVQDITPRKEREEREHLLMREVNHRAKNMLSVVDAIAHQTAARNPEDFIERFSERIQALSANQDLLVRNEWNGVEIADLVRAQLAHFADLIGSRIAMHGPKLRLNPASAQAIGLALHELATNAGKYGALSTDRGRVDVSWGTDGDTLTMGWTEREGPPVSAPKRRGFGTIVMEAMAERSVDGKVDLDYAPSGLTWRLTCPAANALEPREREQTSGEGDAIGAVERQDAAVAASTGMQPLSDRKPSG